MKYYNFLGKRFESDKLKSKIRKVLRETAVAALALVSGFVIWLIMSL
ncbi:MAG: hypothetical protein PHW45_04715 [Candidatus ainarchaeum sp.]|nr:hypothetical protein [Candidatus ainarchaeum sp.]MDD4003209.1 hypothetical protein [Clostridia bacterium]